MNEKDIKTYITEVVNYVELRAAIKWLRLNLQAPVDRYNYHRKLYSETGWRLLGGNHPDADILREKARDVRETWYKRPRFKKH